jgi:hypothetical protein
MKVYSVTMLGSLACRNRLENYQRLVSVEVFNSFEKATEVAEGWAGEGWAKRGEVYHFYESTRAAIVKGHRI